MTKYQNIPILEIAILEMARMKMGKSFSPEEVIQWIFPDAWQNFIPDILLEIERLHQEGKIKVLENGNLPDFPLSNEKGIIISNII